MENLNKMATLIILLSIIKNEGFDGTGNDITALFFGFVADIVLAVFATGLYFIVSDMF